MTLVLPNGERGVKRDAALKEFAREIATISGTIGFKVSSRGWGYLLEGQRLINKDQFNLVENAINDCREKGFLPVDFVAEEEGRKFSGVDTPEEDTPAEYLIGYLDAISSCKDWYNPDWWKNEEYYIQMLVEKIDLKTLFEPVCKRHHIPIATSSGWSSILQRAEYARRFREAEENGLQCVLLYCGDHDPDGLRISQAIRKNLKDLEYIRWSNGDMGYNPDDLIIDRFGLNYDFIVANNLTWIDNLITGSGKYPLNDPNHKNHGYPYVQDYLKKYGVRKCEANAIMTPDHIGAGRQLCLAAIEKYLGHDAGSRFVKCRKQVQDNFDTVRSGVKINGVSLDDFVQKSIDILSGDNHTGREATE